MDDGLDRTQTLDYEIPRRKPDSPADPRIVALIFGLPTLVLLIGILIVFVWFAANFWSGMRLN